MAVIGAIVLASCSAQTGSTLPSSQSRATLGSSLHTASYPNVVGTYTGTWKQTAYYGAESGRITIKVRQYLDYLWGPITLEFAMHRSHLGFTGILKQHGKHLGFDMVINRKRTHDTGHATVDGSKLSGTIVFMAHGSVPKTIIAFTTTKR
ncbi:MAG TPA: hypothetical protein VHT92_08620 [Candidatus Cybelea sp.]|nr:hypothetical protein [Candidatus Cybelea sp.]